MSEEKASHKPAPRKGTVLLCLALWSVISFLVFSRYGVSPVVITGESMFPTLKPGECYIVHRWLPLIRGYRRGDLVLFRDNDDQDLSIKRLIALPHDRIQFKHGRVFVNGRILIEPYLPKGAFTLNPKREADKLIELGPQSYFLMGDNRSVSLDSRYLGPVQSDSLVGKIVHN
ncbi:MAG: signal peptidase I [Verrucomicrobiota bacterium]